MIRPYVVCHMQASIDGRISGRFFFTPEADAVYERDNEIRNGYKADALMNGAVTCAEIYADGFLSERPILSGCCSAIPRGDFVCRPHAGRFVVCVDTKGTLQWSRNTVCHRGGPDAHVIEVLTEDIDEAYLSYLRELGISYIFAGETELDLPLALQKLSTLFGIERILLTGGGQMNWTFLEAGCIDELSLVILPFVSGSTDSAGIFDRPFSEAGCDAFASAAFTLAHAEKLPGDALWLRYHMNK